MPRLMIEYLNEDECRIYVSHNGLCVPLGVGVRQCPICCDDDYRVFVSWDGRAGKGTVYNFHCDGCGRSFELDEIHGYPTFALKYWPADEVDLAQPPCHIRHISPTGEKTR